MSLFTTLSTNLIAGSLAIAGSIGGVGAIAASNPAIKADFQSVQTAITAKDLGGYKTAKTQLINDTTKAETDQVNATTQDQLNTMSDKQIKMKATKDAITNNDYNAFKTNADQRMLTRVTDQAGFDKLVTINKAHLDQANKIADAIKNNDFSAFKTAESNEQTNETNDKQEKSGPAPTDTQLQTQFDKLAANYKANGSLPTDQKGFGRFGMGGRGNGGERGQVKEINKQ
jgi:hypothetical protein